MSELFTELSAADIESLRGSARQTGVYRKVIEDFVASGIAGADVTGMFPGRKPTSAAQQLKKIANKDFQGQVDVIHVTRDGQETVALVRSNATA
jgi:hypothetical protein